MVKLLNQKSKITKIVILWFLFLFLSCDNVEEHIVYYETGNVKSISRYNKIGKRDGVYEEYYLSGQLKTRITYENDKRVGNGEYYYDDGNIKKIETYNNDTLDIDVVEYYKNNNIYRAYNLLDGIANGKFFVYNIKGELSQFFLLEDEVKIYEKILDSIGEIINEEYYSCDLFLDSLNSGAVEIKSKLKSNKEYLELSKPDTLIFDIKLSEGYLSSCFYFSISNGVLKRIAEENSLYIRVDSEDKCFITLNDSLRGTVFKKEIEIR